MQGTTGDVETNAQPMYSYGLPQMDTPVLTDQQRFARIIK